MPETQTPYGPVDLEALRALQDSFDTGEILRMVDRFDAMRTRFCEPAGVRDDLLRLHAMAHTVINGAILSASTQGTTLVEQADEIVDELEDWITVFRRGVQVLQALQRLRCDR